MIELYSEIRENESGKTETLIYAKHHPPVTAKEQLQANEIVDLIAAKISENGGDGTTCVHRALPNFPDFGQPGPEA